MSDVVSTHPSLAGMPHPGVLSGKVALVTGAARNLGRAYAEALGAQGATVILHHHGSPDDAQDAAKAVEAAGGTAGVEQADLTDLAQTVALFDRVQARHGRFDILVNNAGMVLKKPLSEFEEDEYDRLFAINTKAAFFCMREAARRISDNGRIINLGTTLLGATTGYYSAYAGSKAPLEDFTRGLAKEIGHRGVTVNTVAPGPIDTSFFHAAETPESEAFLSSMSVTGHLGRVDQIVPMIAFLASPAAQWVTAQTIFVNGGFLAR